MATIRLIPSTYALSNSSYFSVSNINNAYANIDSTNYATFQTTNASTSSRYIYLRGFDFSSIPSGAIISNFVIKIKGYESGANTSTSYAPRLVNGTSVLSNTTASENFSTSTKTITIPTGALTWDTIVNTYGSNFGIQVDARRNSRNTASYIYIYGVEIEVTYTVPVSYTVTATSNTSGVTASPATQSIAEGNSATVTFNCNDISNYTVTDNGNDVTSSCVQHANQTTPTTISQVPGSNVTTGHYRSGGAFYQNSSTQSDAWLRYAIGYSAENPYSTSNTSNTYTKDGTNDSNTQGWMIYPFDFSSIPANATITSIEVKCYGAIEDTGQSASHADISLWTGSTQKSTTQKFTSTSNQTITISSPGTWTRAELQDAKLRFGVGYYGGRLLGVTWNVTYTVPATGYYYTYTIPNVTSAHSIVIEEAGAYIPPVEDPTKTYYPITISSINATTTPSNGTTRVEAGDDLTVTITPSDPQLTLALDNGVDITSQLVGGVPLNTYTITTQKSGASYGFNLNTSTGYYVSTNNGQSNSAAVATVNFECESNCLVTIQYINYAEATYDYGIFGKVDTSLGTTYSTDSSSNCQLICSTNAYNISTPQTLTYELTAGSHYIDIKYRKDQAADSNNDNLQWKILSVEATGTGGDYTYTLSNINQKHSLIFVFGNVAYYFVNSTGSNCKLYPDGQLVKLQGDNYSLTIIPNDINATVTISDNNTDRTSYLQYEEGEDKEGNTVVNYIYQLSNISTTHNLIITCISSGGSQLYLKISGTWTPVANVYVKVNGAWVKQTSLSGIFDTDTDYADRT